MSNNIHSKSSYGEVFGMEEMFNQLLQQMISFWRTAQHRAVRHISFGSV